MDPFNLQTAATYINNLLLARGLLRNGKPIDFAALAHGCINDAPNDPADDGNGFKDPKKQKGSGNGGTAPIAAEVINLVHDLILRRDRDQQAQESLTHTLRTVRSTHTNLSTSHDRLTDENASLARQLSLSQSTVRSAEHTARSAESCARSLREEVGRLKTLLGQVRAQCANDVRKRDVQLQKLKGHLAARQRGNKTGVVGSCISITPGVTGRGAAGPSQQGSSSSSLANNNANGLSGQGDEAPGLEDVEYSLRQESTEFLTQLSQGLSDENDALISLVRSAAGTLRELQGLPHNRQQQRRRHRGDGDTSTTNTQHTSSASPGMVRVSPEDHTSDPTQHHPTADDSPDDDSLVKVPPTSYNALSSDLSSVLSSLTELLTNPSFAPIEEVQVREEEIQRLRDGWEQMETRWREAIQMIQGWRKRMLQDGQGVGVEELGRGVGAMGMPMPVPAPMHAGAEVGQGKAEAGKLLEIPDAGDEEINDEDEDTLSGSSDPLRHRGDATPDLPEDEPSFHAPDGEGHPADANERTNNLFDLDVPASRSRTRELEQPNRQLTEKKNANANADPKARPRDPDPNAATEDGEGAKENADVPATRRDDEKKSTGDNDGKKNSASSSSRIPESRKTSAVAGAAGSGNGSVKTKKPTASAIRKAGPTTQQQQKQEQRRPSPIPAASAKQQPQPSVGRSSAQRKDSQPQKPQKRQKEPQRSGRSSATTTTQQKRKRLSVQEKLEMAEREARRVSISSAHGHAGGHADSRGHETDGGLLVDEDRDGEEWDDAEAGVGVQGFCGDEVDAEEAKLESNDNGGDGGGGVGGGHVVDGANTAAAKSQLSSEISGLAAADATDTSGAAAKGEPSRPLPTTTTVTSDETQQQQQKPYKRSRPTAVGRITGRPRKRKSTLSPEELENLMMGGAP